MPSLPEKPPSGGLVGLDLALNCVGGAGIASLHQVLTTAATGMVFLELRGNTCNDAALSRGNNNNNNNGSNSGESKSSTNISGTPALCCSSPSTTEQLLKSIESTCAERRQRLRQRQQPDFRRRASEAVATLRASSSSPSSSPTLSRNNKATQHESKPVDADWHSGTHRRRPWAETRNDRGRRNGGGSGGNSGGSARDNNSDDVGREENFCRLPGCDKSAAKPRPLEGALPIRGHYLSPLLDSCFDLLMLREPAGDPADYSFYVNRTRDKLEQRRELRGQQKQQQQQQQQQHSSGGEKKGRRTAASGTLVVAAAAAGNKNDGVKAVALRRELQEAPPKKGALVSPLTINTEREHVLAERRRLFQVDSDFAQRKNARIAGRGRSKTSRSKILTNKHTNTAFARELRNLKPGGWGAKCPQGLRCHYLGLQNFEYDWGSGERKMN
ncbi:unnamed protein product [Pylaiella littoralis]